MAKKKTNLFVKILAALGTVAVAGGLIFTVMWCVPSIHDAVWPEVTTEQGTDIETEGTETEGTENA